MRSIVRAVLATLLLGVAAPGRALPVSRIVQGVVGQAQVFGAEYLDSAEVEPADLATAEKLPSGAVRVTPLRAGAGLVYLFEDGEVEAFRLRVLDAKADPVPPARPELWAATRASCSGLDEHVVDGERYLHVQVTGCACRKALLDLLATDVFTVGHVRLVFGFPALQAQLADFQALLAAAGITDISLHYQGATLVIAGTVDAATHHRALRLLWAANVGRLDLDDRTQDPDGGP